MAAKSITNIEHPTKITHHTVQGLFQGASESESSPLAIGFPYL